MGVEQGLGRVLEAWESDTGMGKGEGHVRILEA